MRVAEAAGQTLAQLGVRHFFGLIGSGNFHLAIDVKIQPTVVADWLHEAFQGH